MTDETNGAGVSRFDVVIVGAGFSGLYMLHRLRRSGFSVRLLEAGSGVGGTWFWNRYPGCRCDIESLEYQYGFDDEVQRGWTWSEKYATQPEIRAYMEYVADKLDLNRDIQLETRVTSAVYDEDARQWAVATDGGTTFTGRFCVMATGSLSATRIPEFSGLESFQGRNYHTGDWPSDGVDFTGRRVAVIGTGSSGIQLIPIAAQQAEHLTVFQRTPNFTFPAGNRPIAKEEMDNVRSNFTELRDFAHRTRSGSFNESDTEPLADHDRAEALALLERAWNCQGPRLLSCFPDTMVNPETNDFVAEFVRGKIREIVQNPELARKLTPVGYPIGAKRAALDTNYYDTFNRPNTTLVDVREEPIERITPGGILAGGKEYALDDIVFATGYDAMTGALSRIDIRGRADVTLAERWKGGPKTYLGLQVAGFPNLFMMAGAGSPSVLAIVIRVSEQNVEWISQCLEAMRVKGVTEIEALPDAEEAWGRHVSDVAHATLFVRADSWYLGANVPGKPRVFMPYVGGLNRYSDACEKAAADGYSGFAFT